MTKRIAAILAVVLLFAGCASQQEDARYEKDGVQYGTTKGVFRGRWWSYYERGTSFLAGKFYDEALRDFEEALRGRNRDSWRARTYGLHFVEFFPNRELGATLFHLGRLDEAETYLNRSLGEVDTERARFYLDEIKRARIANGSLKDDVQPDIETAFAEPVVIASSLKPVELAPEEPMAVPAPAPEPVKAAEPEKKAEAAPKPAEKPAPAAKPAPKPVAQAETKPAEAPKAETKAAEAPKPAPAPQAKPAEAPKPEVKTAEAPKPAAEPAPAPSPAPAPAEAAKPAAPVKIVTEPVVPVEVATKDDVGVVKVAVNGKQLPQRGSAQQLKFRDDVVVKEGAQSIAVTATDLADKAVTKEVPIVADFTGPTIGVFSPIEPTVTPEGAVVLDGASVDKTGVANVAVADRRIAEADGAKKLPFNTSLPLGNGENVFVVAARDTGGNETRSAVKVFRGDPNSREAKLWLLKQKRPDLFLFASNGQGDLDTLLRMAQAPGQAPVNEIRLKSPALDRPYRHNRTLRVSGEVVTSSAVRSLTINGEAVNEISGAAKESFNKRIPIDAAVFETGAGSMPVEIVAVTTAGQVLEKKFTVALAPVEVESPALRMPLAILAFAGAGVDAAVGDRLRAATEAEIIAQRRFRALAREDLAGALNEQQLAVAYGNPEEAVAVGRLVPAPVFLVADVYSHDGKGLEVKGRVVDTRSGELAGTIDVFIEDMADEAQFQQKCGELAAQLAGLFPRVAAEVTEVRGADIVIDAGSADGVRPGSEVVLLRPGAAWTDADTGEVLEPGEMRQAARARIVSVGAESSRAVAIELNEEGAAVEQGMAAITL